MKSSASRETDQWKAAALSFAAGAASMSLLWYARDTTRRRRGRRRSNTTDSDSNNTDDCQRQDKNGREQQHTPASSYNYYNNYNTDSLRQSPSFIDTVKQSVEDAVEDIRSRIGELPATRTHWPWETIHKNNTAKKNTATLLEPNNTNMKLTPDQPAVQENPELCIGSIFGLDVGGTLAKLVYFEQRQDQDGELPNVREKLYHRAASAQAVLKARRGHPQHAHNKSGHHPQHRSSMSSLEPLRERSFSGGLLRRKFTTTSSADNLNATGDDTTRGAPAMEMDAKEHCQPTLHSTASDDDLENLYRVRPESVPDDLNAFATSVHYNNSKDDNDGRDNHDQKNFNFAEAAPAGGGGAASAGLQQSSSSGAGMKKSRSMFDLSMSQKSRDHADALNRFYHFARKLDTYREGVKDHKLSFYSRPLGGEFHFIRFETRRMENAMELIRANDLHLFIREMGATGGGAHKYAADWDQKLGIRMKKEEELDSLVAGMQFVLSTVVGECYTFRPRKNSKGEDKPVGSNAPFESTDTSSTYTASASPSPPPSVSASSSTAKIEEEKKSPSPVPRDAFSSDESDSEEGDDRDCHGTDEWWWSRKVQRDAISYSSTYPYLLVTIGTGVSILRVDGPRKHERISGSTIGGGTYWGLIRLLTDLEDFEDVMRLAEHGDPSKVDMMVGDIYGNNKDALEKLGLPASLVASSFGKLVAMEDPAAGLKQEDLARALLLMVTNNIGQVAYLNAQLHKTSRIYFVGNFLRGNKLSQRRLSFAINYWSKGEMEALFLEHEGYFGALGAFLLSQDISIDGLEPPAPRTAEKKKRGKVTDRQHRRSQTLEDLF